MNKSPFGQAMGASAAADWSGSRYDLTPRSSGSLLIEKPSCSHIASIWWFSLRTWPPTLLSETQIEEDYVYSRPAPVYGYLAPPPVVYYAYRPRAIVVPSP